MKKLLLVLIVTIMLLTMAVPIAAYSPKCPDLWTGETKYEWGRTFWLYKCINNRYWWERKY